MPDLALPVQGYSDADTMQDSPYALPVAAPNPNIPRVVIDTSANKPDNPNYTGVDTTLVPVDHDPWEAISRLFMQGVDDKSGASERPILKKLFGFGGEERYQTWPEKLIRSGATAAGDVMSGEVPQYDVDPVTGELHTSSKMIERAMDMSALAGTGGLAGVTDGTLGATPFLRPALKYEGKIYKAPVGAQHLDAIPKDLYPEFQRQAMNGEDISNFNFGFTNDKGHFLNREDALKYGIDTGLIDPQAGKFGALTSTLMADSSKPGSAIEATAKTAQPFYSALEHNVNQIQQPKMTGEQWLGTLSNKPGVKPEEMQWTGLKDYLEQNKGQSVTKEQIQDHLNNNKVEIKDVDKNKGLDKEHFNQVVDDLMGEEISSFKETNNRLPTDEENLKLRQQVEKYIGENPDDYGIGMKEDTKYHSYQLPGGENYREKLLTLPDKKFAKDDPRVIAEAKAAYNEKDIPKLTEGQWDMLRSRAARRDGDKLNEQYKSSHWDEPNILAHVRMNDRMIDGKKSLHLEEIQSDWHQQGRDRGYKSEAEALNKKGNQLLDEYEKAKADRDNLSGKETLEEINAKVAKVNSLRDQIAETKSAYNKLNGGVPDAPFKKSWHELALKRMIREAAEKGYDRLSWTPGEAQAARYDLSKSVDKIAVPMVNENGTRSVRIDAKQGVPFKLTVNREGKVFSEGASSDQFRGKPLSDVVGKEMAEKIMKLEKPSEFSGENLKIGGEGMKGFYDQIIPKALEKISGEKVKRGNLPSERMSVQPGYKEKSWDVVSQDGTGIKKFDSKAEAEQYVRERGTPVHYIDLPQSLKDKAMSKGFPLFSNGIPLMPVEHNPWEKKK